MPLPFPLEKTHGNERKNGVLFLKKNRAGNILFSFIPVIFLVFIWAAYKNAVSYEFGAAA